MQPVFNRIGETSDRLGESPIWSISEQALYWIDIRGQKIRRYSAASGHIDSWNTPSLPGSIGFCDDGRLIVAQKSSIDMFDPKTGSLTTVASPEFDDPDVRFNDGRVDRQGRFWVGSMNDVTRAPVGHLYRIGADLKPVPMFGGIRCPNSLCWSPRSDYMYFADSDLRTIFEYDFDAVAGEPKAPRPLAEIAGNPVPDGCIVDADGCLWCAIYGAGQVIRYTPSGKIDRIIETPVSQPTSCAFGGADLKTLYVTTAFQRLSEEQLGKEPLAGALLAIELDVSGLAEPLFLSSGRRGE